LSNFTWVAELINQINNSKISNEELTIIGHGMGGVVARYALAYMEEHNMSHETGLYVSLDAPHKGLNFPVGIQLLINDFGNNFLVAPFSTEIWKFKTIINSPAFKQLVPYQLPLATASQPHNVNMAQTHIDFYEELRTLNNCNGYPTKSRNVAASLGSWNIQPQYTSDSLLFDSTTMKQRPQYAGMANLFMNYFCNFNATLDLIQVGIGSSFSTSYPHFSDVDTLYNNQGIDVLYLTLFQWGTYASLGNDIILGHPPVFFGPVVNKPNSPIDIAPGSTFPYYKLADELVNRFSGIQCTFLLSETATFIPTISALDFDTKDYFYDIEADADKLLKTPFDDIFGITGDNLSHVEGNIFNLDLLTWLNNQVTNFSDVSCAFGDLTVEGVIINSIEEELYNESLTLTVSDVTVEVDANVKFYASESIKMLENTKLKAGSKCIAGIKSCTPKVCLYEPSFRIATPQNNGSLASVEKVKILDDAKIPLDEIGVNIYPNPTTNQITVESSKSYHLNVFNMMGQQVGQENGKAKIVQYNMTEFEAGIYIFQFRFEDGTTEIVRIIKQ
jgi:hypothetical protein